MVNSAQTRSKSPFEPELVGVRDSEFCVLLVQVTFGKMKEFSLVHNCIHVFEINFDHLSLPSKGRACLVSSSRSDLRKYGAASPNSLVSKRDMVATPRRFPNHEGTSDGRGGSPWLRRSKELSEFVLERSRYF